MVDIGVPGCDWSNAGGTDCGFNVQPSNGSTVYSEMASLFYDTLGNKGICPPGSVNCNNSSGQSGWGLTNTGEFIYLQPVGSRPLELRQQGHAGVWDTCVGRGVLEFR
jgi:hypothetical protein